MIPKIIHYCWFGVNPMPETEANYVSNWRKILPDYEFMLWDEQNFDIYSTKFTKQTASVQKWAFVSDYVHAYAVYNYGGISLDTDVEVLKKFDDLLDNKCFAGFNCEHYVNPGSAFGGEKGCKIALETMKFYENYNSFNRKGILGLSSSPIILSEILLNYGFQQNNTYQNLPEITIYPSDYFSCKSYDTGKIEISKNTYSVHHFSGSWLTKNTQKPVQERWAFHEKYGNDEYLVNMYKQLEFLRNRSVDNMRLKKLYKIVIKRTINKLFHKIVQHRSI